MDTYYPLAVGNSWTYKMTDGSTFTNRVTANEGDAFTMTNSLQPDPQHIRKEGATYLSDHFEPGNFQTLVRDDLSTGDTWDIRYTANTIDTVLTMTVKGTGGSKEVEGTTYNKVIELEGVMAMTMNGNAIPSNYVVQYFYAAGVGLILTTSSMGDDMPLISSELH